MIGGHEMRRHTAKRIPRSGEASRECPDIELLIQFFLLHGEEMIKDSRFEMDSSICCSWCRSNMRNESHNHITN